MTRAVGKQFLCSGLKAVAQFVLCVRPFQESEWQDVPFALDLDFYFLSNAESVFKLDTEISDGAVNFRMPEQKLHRAQVACLAINLRSLRPS